MKTPRKLKASDTPETDKQAVNVIGWYSCATVPAEFARELERDRNLCKKAGITWMRSWTEIHNRVTQAEVAAEEAQKHCAKFEADACDLWAERTEHRMTKASLSALAAERNQLRRALAQVAEDCTAWLHNERAETACEFIKAVRAYAHEQSQAPLAPSS